jgi:hypothetical protein
VFRKTVVTVVAVAAAVGGVLAPSAAFAGGGQKIPAEKAKVLASLEARTANVKQQQQALSAKAKASAAKVQAASPGIEEAWPSASRSATCLGVASGIRSNFSDYVRAGITSGSTQGNSHMAWVGSSPFYANTTHLGDAMTVAGVAVYWNAASSWKIAFDTIHYDRDINTSWYQDHSYSLTYTGFITYYTHTTSGLAYFPSTSCSINATASSWF